MKGLLGGRASEELVFSEVSTGAENDLEHATTLARSTICLYGMGEAVGLVHCAAAVDVPAHGRRRHLADRLQSADRPRD